jgi:multidrug transporter EmrE-like cation transporter
MPPATSIWQSILSLLFTEINDLKKKRVLGDLLFLQMAVLVYSLDTVCAKFASQNAFLSPGYIFFFGLEFVVLGIYAVLWQQAIKHFQLSIAYANKAMGLLWSMLWSHLIFRQGITPAKVIGVLLVMAGVIVMNMGESGEKSKELLEGGGRL